MCAKRTFVWAVVAVALLVSPLAVSPAQAQMRTGVQGGMSVDPDQIFFGAHVRTAPLVDQLRFRPSLDLGIGEDITLVGLNFDFTYSFRSKQPWGMYVGAGPSMNISRFNNSSNTQAGFDFIIGAQHRDGLFGELKVGAGGAPGLKLGIGYTFR
jgi:hypothetical protein